MTGSVALDVVIGLVFIFLLYSTLATVIMEVIADFLRLRTINMQRYVRFMLSDSNESTLSHLFQKPCQGNLLCQRFFAQPSIKNLTRSRLIRRSGAAYMEPKTFVDGLIETLVATADDSATSEIQRTINMNRT